jgi:UDP-3-O-[3-hydroxymyristoyl] glucosamine N-acyltransferase
MQMSVAELAELVGGELVGDPSVTITGVSSTASAAPDQIVFAEDPETLAEAVDSLAGAVVAPPNVEAAGKALIRVENPRLAFIVLARALHPPARPAPGVHETAVIDESATIGEDVHIGPHTTVGADVVVGYGTVIEAGCVVGDGCRIGADTRLFPRVTLYPSVTLGDRVVVHSGAVLGADGFGYLDTPEGKVKFPQLGTVVVEDDVEIGANTTVDRGALDATVIGRGTKLDNLVQIAHNVRLGPHCALAAQVGIAGTSVLGEWVLMGGQAAVADHAEVGDRAIIGARGAVARFKRLPGNRAYLGTPVRPVEEMKRQWAEIALLGKLRKQVKEIARRVATLEGGDS